jgi:K+-sensing histidine kinase KdpD
MERMETETPLTGSEAAVTGVRGSGDTTDLEPYLSHTVRTQLTIITLLSTNLDLLYDRLDDEKRKKMIRELREQTRLLNGLVVNALEMLHGTDS